MTDTGAAEACLKLLDDLISAVHHLEADAATVDLGNNRTVHLHTTAQVEAWLAEERRNLEGATLGGLAVHEHPAWRAGVRWAAAEIDAQVAGHGYRWSIDHTDHLRACADDPQRRTAVPRTEAPAEHVGDE